MQHHFAIFTVLAVVCLFGAPGGTRLAAAAKYEIPENMRKIVAILHEHCIEVTGIAETDVAMAMKGEMPEDHSFGCYINCMLDTVGLISHTGHIRLQDVSHLFPSDHKEIIDQMTNDCDGIHGADVCEIAYLTVKCYMNHEAARGLITGYLQ